ncbi:MAG TPA: FKBP-type peptidyl-prolyl cis-trans isomerase [Anaeromyxobacteraceae bacterium]|nr:FKBP-type peptidyl-prolyl cis-trans isomerase [Anaeromyxobacteraceae bacterium]
MKKHLLTLSIAALAACAQQATPKPVVSDQDKTLHAVGLVVAKNLEVFQLTPEELERVIDGVRAGHAGKGAVKLEEFQGKIGELARSRMASNSGKRKDADAKAVAALTSDPKAEKLPSGLVYIPVTEGTGPSPKATDRVKVHYAGTLTDGKEFDSSIKRGEPITFPLNGVIPCWTEGVQKMKVGGKAKLVCPSSIAYGDDGRPPVIPGGATLVFEVQLLGIEAGAPAPAAPPAGHPAMPAKK